MAHEILNDYQEETPKEKVVYKTIQQGLHELKIKVPIFVDALTLFIIAFWYFFFTGIAIVLGKQLPKEWLKIATRLAGEKLSRKIAGKEVIKKPNSIKVVDIETQRPIPLL